MELISEALNFVIQLKDYIGLNNFDYTIFLINILIITFIFLSYYDIKLMDIYKDKHILMIYSIIVVLELGLELAVGPIPVVTGLLSFFSIHIIFFIKDRKTFDSLNKNNNSNLELDDLHYRLKKIGKESNFNIIDILYIYDYITAYQRRKLLQTMISSDMDDMLNYLTERPVISQEELKEAKAIQNLIEFENRLVTKEEAVSYLIKQEEPNKNDNEKDGE